MGTAREDIFHSTDEAEAQSQSTHDLGGILDCRGRAGQFYMTSPKRNKGM